MKSPLSRRAFVRNSALAAASLPLANVLAGAGATTAAPAPNPVSDEAESAGPGALCRWLERAAPRADIGVAWGVPWKRGEHAANASFALQDGSGRSVPVQSWPLAYWPDGTLKWTAHAAVLGTDSGASFRVLPGSPAQPAAVVTVEESGDEIRVETGVMGCRLARSGEVVVRQLLRGGVEVARNGRLIGSRQDRAEQEGGEAASVRPFAGHIDSVTVEQKGPVRAVVAFRGHHREKDGRQWLPFTVRLYFHAGSEAIRMMHTFIFDGDEHKDFIRGLGVRFEVPMRDPLHDRHIRFSGEGDGVWGEATRPLTGLRRDPGAEARTAQVAGRPTPPVESFPPVVKDRLDLIPAWGDFTLTQLSADGFQIRKRTKPGHGWIPAGAGRRASGVGYVGGISGGLVFGQRDFWQRHPTQLDIRGATGDAAEATLWLWSPEAPPMDLRFYHDGLGMDTHPEQLSGMEITYEDYEPGFGTPMGTARTNELMFWAVSATPERKQLAAFAAIVRQPPLLACAPGYIRSSRALGELWTLSSETPAQWNELERRQNFLLEFYKGQVEQRRWYGFWDYGDVMHTYDADRHVWRYDIGGFAWDNSELSPDLWLWYAYLRSGRSDVFRLAEAMTRHTGEVDVHHLGRFKGLGSRHNVQHWGCSAKQVRVSNALYRRPYYYLTADERVGDLLEELKDSHRAYLTLLATRKIPGDRPKPPGPEGKAVYMSVGTDWGSVAGAWLAQWERTGDVRYRDRLLNSMKSIAALPRGFFSGGGLMDVETGTFTARDVEPARDRLGVSHLNAVFGLVEVCAELLDLVEVPEFEKAWLEYCELYNAPADVQVQRLGKPLAGNGLTQAHARLTAYAAKRRNDPALAERAWKEFGTGRGELLANAPLELTRVEGPDVLSAIDEAKWISTNSSAQWGLAAIQLLAWAGGTAAR